MIKRQENNSVASFSLSLTSEKHIFFALMMSLSPGHFFEYAVSQRKDQKMLGKIMIDCS